MDTVQDFLFRRICVQLRAAEENVVDMQRKMMIDAEWLSIIKSDKCCCLLLQQIGQCGIGKIFIYFQSEKFWW